MQRQWEEEMKEQLVEAQVEEIREEGAWEQRLQAERERWEREHAQAQAAGQGVTPEEIERAMRALALEREAEALRQEWPGFDLAGALAVDCVRALVDVGEPLGRACAYARWEEVMEDAREQGRQEVLASIRARMTRPSALPRPALGSVDADFGNMPEAALRAIDARLKRGERVRCG